MCNQCLHWLEGIEQPLLVWTDRKNLEYLKTVKRPGPLESGLCYLAAVLVAINS